MGSREFIVLYTHQKMKKSKVWQDGILKVTHVGNKAILYDDKGGCLDSLFLKCLEVKPGDDLESDRYLITVEDVKVVGSVAVKRDVVTEAPRSNSRPCVPWGRSLGCQPAGLKRKFTGFQGPRQAPKKTAVPEEAESAAPPEAGKPGPGFLSPFCTPCPLFPAAGREGVGTTLTGTSRSGAGGGRPFSAAASAPPVKVNPEAVCGEARFCSPVGSVNKHCGSLLTGEPTRGDGWASHCSGASQNIRSKAQILALLQGKPAVSKEVKSKVTECVPQGPPRGALPVAAKPGCLIDQEASPEVRTETSRGWRQSESTTGRGSPWAACSSSRSSPARSTAGGSRRDRKPTAQGENVSLYLKDAVVHQRAQLLEACAENGQVYGEGKPVAGSNDRSWDQGVNAEITSFCGSDSSPVACGDAEGEGSLAESDAERSVDTPAHQDDLLCPPGGDAREAHLCGAPGRERRPQTSFLPGSEHLRVESSPSDGSGMPGAAPDVFSEGSTDAGSQAGTQEPMRNVTPPVFEVTFNLNHFKTSDTEEESQESDRISQGSECWVEETLVDVCSPRVERGREDVSCDNGGSGHSPLLTPAEPSPTEETLPSQLCGQARVGVDMGPWAAGSPGDSEDPDGSSDSASQWTGAVRPQDADRSVQDVRTSRDCASLLSKPQGMNLNLHCPHFLNMATNQNPANSPFSEQPQPGPGPVITGGDLASPTPSASDSTIHLSRARQTPSEEGMALDQSDPQGSSSLFCPLGREHPVFKDAEARDPAPAELGGVVPSLHDHPGVGVDGKGRQPWASPGASPERPGLVDSISLLKSLSEHSTALEALEELSEKTATFEQGVLQAQGPGSGPAAAAPWSSVTSQGCPRLNQESQQFFPLGSEEEAALPAAVPKQTERRACGPQVTSPEQTMSTSGLVSTFSLDSRDDDLVLDFSEGSLRARASPAVKKLSSVEEGFQRPLLRRRARLPLTTGPAAADVVGWGGPEAAGCPRPCRWDPAQGSGPEDQGETTLSQVPGAVAPGGASLLGDVCPQSKWLKYQDPAQRNPTAVGGADGAAAGGKPSGTAPVQAMRGLLCLQPPAFSGPGLARRTTVLPPSFRQTSGMPGVPGASACCSDTAPGEHQGASGSALCFPGGREAASRLPRRQTRIPAVFQSPAHYRQVFTAGLVEHLNVLLLGLAQRLRRALSEADVSFYTSSKGARLRNAEHKVPSCHHRQPAKLVVVQKDGPNQGRLFYACGAPRTDRCRFFKWLGEVTPGHPAQDGSPPGVLFSDVRSLGSYLRGRKVPLHEECQLLVRRGFDFRRKHRGKLKKFTPVSPEFHTEPKSRLYLKLRRKESSAAYSKDDLWVVSKTLDFELDTFIARSAFFGPSATNEVELLPLTGFRASSWCTDTVVHALLVCNASMELAALDNLRDHFHPATLPLARSLLTAPSSSPVSSATVAKRTFVPPAFSDVRPEVAVLSLGAALQVAGELIRAHTLNQDQAAALTQIAHMMAPRHGADPGGGLSPQVPPITVIQGVFGAGKSYLLAVVVLFLMRLFERSEAPSGASARPWSLLISSSTNVAVDRVLLGLLGLGFEGFVRVGSVRKIARPVLPYSLHAGPDGADEELKQLHALLREDLTPAERICVRRSIERHRLGTGRTLLRQVRVVGVTCAACLFPCLSGLQFPVVLLDEGSQMTEPASLLPVARFACEKLILVGDPKQLPPTIAGSEAAHGHGLEQTLLDRLCLMGHKPVLLRTQYRCHPAISAVANDLFYDGVLRDGVSEADRGPLLDWLPTLCFYNVRGAEQVERESSFHNEAEAAFTLTLVQALVAGGVAGAAIGVLTLYRAQAHKICQLLGTVECGQPEVRAVQVSTVDAFQGAEKEVIVLSCVRTRHVGFIDAERRVNVALTRGRRHLLLVGSLACLRRDALWARVIQHCAGREDGLRHASQCEPGLRRLLGDRCGRRAAEPKTKSEKDTSRDTSRSHQGAAPGFRGRRRAR